MKKNRIGIIGHFGGDKNFYDGQTIKTKTLYEELIKTGRFELITADTYYIKTLPIKLLWQTLMCLCKCENIIILLSGRGMSVYFPLLYYWGKVFEVNVFHDIIGGSLAKFIDQKPRWKKYINSFKVNWAETTGLVESLKERGVSNAELLYNFKSLKPLSKEEIIQSYSEPYPICTFSRVMKEKGIEDAVEAVKAVNEKNGRIVFTLDIYGQVDAEQIDWFEELKEKFPYYVKYRGSVPYDKSVETLKGYFALIFPTKYYTEGVPGTIIDAYAAGLPVIASYWENFDNIVDEKTGVSYQFNNVEDFVRVLTEIAEKPEIIIEKKRNCIERAADFTPETVLKQIISKITEE